MNENFSSKIKEELCTTLTDRDKKYSFLYGLLLFSHRFLYGDNKSFRTECSKLSQIFPSLVNNSFGNISVDHCERLLKDGRIAHIFRFTSEDSSIISKEYSIYPTREIDLTKIDRNSMMSFLSGAFVSCGSVSNPSKDYHLEFCVPQKLLADDLIKVLRHYGIEFRLSTRRNFYIVYVKGSESIEDTLTLMGAERSTLEIMNVKIFKSVQNRLNRRSNCERANYVKSMNAVKKQLDDIEYIDRTIGIESLPDNLIETAYARLDNPDMSLRELCEALENHVGRSGLNRRLQKISSIAQCLRDDVNNT